MHAHYSVLSDHMANPRNSGSLKKMDGRGIVTEDNGNAVRIAITVENRNIVDIAFLAFGDPIIKGCASFLTICLTGQPIGFAACVRTFTLAYVLRLSDEERSCAKIVVKALHLAIKDYRARHKRERSSPLHVSSGGAPRGHRQVQAIDLPPPTPRDVKLLRPGESHADLIRERAEILGMLQRLDECFDLAEMLHPFQKDETSNLREELLCSIASLKKTIPKLSKKDLRLVGLVGLKGLNEREAAEVLGVTHQAVNKHLWMVAYRVQKMWRDPLSDDRAALA